MTKNEEILDIPMDLYESNDEITIIIPLWWVDKESIEISLEKTTIIVSGERLQPKIKESLIPLKQECFRWKFQKDILLPQNVYFDKIHTQLLKNNVLVITVPKIIIPEKIKLQIEII